MNTYLITYDLMGLESRPEYTKLINEIKNFEDWAKPTYSTWLVKSYLGPQEVYSRLSAYLDSNDKILIIKVTDSWWSLNLHTNVIDWIKKGLS